MSSTRRRAACRRGASARATASGLLARPPRVGPAPVRHRSTSTRRTGTGYVVTELLGLTEDDRLYLPVLFSHCFDMVMGNLGVTSHGACIVIPSPTFEPRAALEAVEAERCTAIYGVPTMFIDDRGTPRPTSRPEAPAGSGEAWCRPTTSARDRRVHRRTSVSCRTGRR